MPKIAFDLIKEINGRTKTPMALHGGTGLDEATIKQCIANGCAKVNISTNLKHVFVESFVDRVASEIDSRVDMRVAQVASSRPFSMQRRRGGTFLALSSITLGIPITAIAGDFAHAAGIAIAWGGIVLVNVANAWRPAGGSRYGGPYSRR